MADQDLRPAGGAGRRLGVHPATRLASFRVAQGRLEEADQLASRRGPPEAVRAMVALHLARGQTALAAARLHRRLNEIGQDNLVTVPLLAQLVEVQLAQPDLGGAAETAEALAAIAARSGHVQAQAEAELALGSVRAATGDASVREHLDRSLGLFVRLRMPHAAGRVHLALARTLAEVLLGDREPGGRLPTVWPAGRRPARLCGVHPRGQLRLRPRRGRTGVLLRPRPGRQQLGLPGGHRATALDPDHDAVVTVRVRNTGPGQDGVAQVDASRPPAPSSGQPLAGRVRRRQRRPGQEVTVEVTVPAEVSPDGMPRPMPGPWSRAASASPSARPTATNASPSGSRPAPEVPPQLVTSRYTPTVMPKAITSQRRPGR